MNEQPRMRRRHRRSFAIAASSLAVLVGVAFIRTTDRRPTTGGKAMPGACPVAFAFRPDGTAPRDGPLVPQAATAVRLCRYAGLNQPAPHSLIAQSEVTDVAQVRRLGAHLNASQTVPSGKVYSCPNDDGSGIAMVFNSGATVTMQLKGCGWISSPSGLRQGGPDVRAEVLGLVPA